MGASLFLTGFVMWRHGRFGRGWAVPAIVLGTMLVVLNGLTAPVPPNAAGLFDVGPLTALYGVGLSGWIIRIGAKLPRA